MLDDGATSPGWTLRFRLGDSPVEQNEACTTPGPIGFKLGGHLMKIVGANFPSVAKISHFSTLI